MSKPKGERQHIGKTWITYAGIRITCYCLSYKPPADETPSVQRAAHRAHRLAMGEKVASPKVALTTAVSQETIDLLDEMAARTGVTRYALARNILTEAAQETPGD